MEALAAAIAKKKEGLRGVPKKRKYMRRGDLKKLEEASTGAADSDGERPATKATSEAPVAAPPSGGVPSPAAGAGRAASSPTAAADEDVDYGVAETVKRLRRMGAPITLFGEQQSQRMARLRKLEDSSHDDMALGEGHDIGNAFLKQDDKKRATYVSDDEEDDQAAKRRKSKHGIATLTEFMAKAASKKYSKETYILKFFRQLLNEWAQELADRPPEAQHTAKGREELRTQKQCKDYMQPFFRMCKKRTVDANILEHIWRIVGFMSEREYLKASDQYIQLSIGNAPWPIGVTSVGIHERAARTKINTNNVAHVMNDECQRKYITSMKRLITVCQRRYPTDPSKAFMP